MDLGVFAGRSHLQTAEILADIPAAIRRMTGSLSRHELTASDVFLQTGEEPSVHAASKESSEQAPRYLEGRWPRRPFETPDHGDVVPPAEKPKQASGYQTQWE